MKASSVKVYLVIGVSLLLGIILSIWPLPGAMNWLRPGWVILSIIYWTLVLPNRVGIRLAWIIGLFLDGLHGSLLGEHALAYSLTCYFADQIRRPILISPLWLQALMIGLLMLIYQVILYLVQGFAGQVISSWQYWLPSLTGAVIWPVIFVLLRTCKQHFRIY
jgi:rod shape-determining protein MreD